MSIINATTPKADTQSRFTAALWGAWIGDALAMPVHWYYKRDLIQRDYGSINDYLKPKNPHPDSILWRSRYESTGEKDNILHDQAEFWGKPGIHYHQNLVAGENTLNLQLSNLLAESIIENKGYKKQDYIERYIEFMLSPGSHQDTYVEEAHRGFFKNYAMGKDPLKCGIEDNHIGALSALLPLILYYHKDKEEMVFQVQQHIGLTHKGINASKASELYAKIIYFSFKGVPMEDILFKTIGRGSYQALASPYNRWISNHSDEEVVGKLVSTACYLEDAMPATLYLALKYNRNFEKGLTQNTHLGGDNCHRGTALGAILGAQNGLEAIPERWLTGLTKVDHYKKLSEDLWAATQ